MTPVPATAPLLRIERPPAAPGATVVVARGAGHALASLKAAEALGVAVGAAVRVAHRGLEVGPARRGPLDRRRRLTLEELLEAAHPTTRLMLDLRGVDPRMPRMLARALTGGRARVVLVCSRSWWMLDPLRAHPGIRVVPTVASARQLGVMLRRCDTEPLDAVAVSSRLLTPETAAALGAMSQMLFAWPVDSPAAAARLRALGVTGLIADRPSIALPAPAAPLAA